MTVEVIRSDALAVAHGFLGRRGGVSHGVVAGLNCGLGSDDDRASVLENRRRAVAAVAPGTALLCVHQIHSAEVVVAADNWGDDARPRADALVTDRPGLLLGIVTADCAPVLFADTDAGVVGAAHAGWKGALAGVTDATVAAMLALGARRERISAVVGPCIAQSSYEVDDAFYSRFDDPRFFRAGRAGHWQFDLQGYVLERLQAAGVRAVGLNLDTYADEARFYSFRRATHRGEPDYGRQLSLIANR